MVGTVFIFSPSTTLFFQVKSNVKVFIMQVEGPGHYPPLPQLPLCSHRFIECKSSEGCNVSKDWQYKLNP